MATCEATKRRRSSTSSGTPHSPRDRPSDEICGEFQRWMQRDKGDPGICLVYDEAGLQAHNPGVSVAQSRVAIAGAIQGAGMVPAVDAQGNQSETMFRGSIEAYIRATNALGHMPWVRHAPGQPDVGKLWIVTGSGASVEWIHDELPFNV